MTKLKLSIILGAIALMVTNCADEDLQPIITFDQVTIGAYPRLVESGNSLINLFDVDGSRFDYTVEFKDGEGGQRVAEYVIEMTYEDNNPGNGDGSAGPVEFRRFTPSDFTTNENGLLEVSVSITANEAISAAGTTAEALEPGDEFNFVSRVVLQDGSVYTDANSAPQITSAAFRGFFDFTMPASCPSELAGTYEVTTTDIWCAAWDGNPITTTVTIEANGGGSYDFNDWSLGAYTPCYGGPLSNWGQLEFQDVCAVVSFTGTVDNYGDTWTFDSEVNGNEWRITWDNTYGESASSVIINPNGWPFTIE